MPEIHADSPLFAWVILPAVIFLARTIDMSLSTLRIVFISQGRRWLAPAVGFFEALVWLFVVGQALSHLHNPLCVVAYAGGFAAGNLLGLYLEERLAIGLRILRIIVPYDPEMGAAQLVTELREIGLGVTVVEGEGMKGPVKILFTLIWRRDLAKALAIVRRDNPKAFFSIEDVRQATQGLMPPLSSRRRRGLPTWRLLRKSR